MKNTAFFVLTLFATSLFISSAIAQQPSDQSNVRLFSSHGLTIPLRFEGKWVNLDRQGYENKWGIVIEEQKPDGTFSGTYWRTTNDGQHCSTGDVPMTGTFDGVNIEVVPKIKQRFCEDSKFNMTLTPDKRLEGLGNSYFNLKVSLAPSVCDAVNMLKGKCLSVENATAIGLIKR